uniref:Zgc:162184 n=1 Tax=Cyprinus carpio TaxID=7962 RepID=A0A8C2IVY4_CYPCA
MPPPLVNKKPRIESTTKNNTGTLDDPLKFLDQDYQELQKSCITSKKIFVDDKFPPDSSSIDPNKKLELDLDQIEWLRPSKLVADPQLIVQGMFIYKDIMDQVMPADQSFGKDYAGIFHFRVSSLEKSENVLPNGIVQGHAYTVTGVFKVTFRGKPVKLVRVLNPWGMGEWNGAWSDKSSLWNKVSVEERTTCSSLANDGEFWMSMEDFSKNFEEINICCLSPDFLDSSSKCSWATTCYNGSWESGTTAGGCINNKDSFWTNPQFRVRIEALDEECASGQCRENILVSLMQIHENRHRSLVSNYFIGFSVYLMKDEKFPAKFFYRRRTVEESENLVDKRHVMKFFKLEPGEYLIVPSTFNPKESNPAMTYV